MSPSREGDEQQRLSLCMIVRDEAFFLADCLAAASPLVDEIVVVDTGSTDATRDIAARFTDKVYDYLWHDDFAAARNFSLERAGGDWILVLDADEVIAPDDFAALRRALDAADRDAYFLTQRNYNNDPLTKDWQPVLRPDGYSRDYSGYRANPAARLFRNRPDIRFHGRVHEVVDTSLRPGRFTALDIAIHHYMDDNPGKPRDLRQRHYLRIIEQDLDNDASGRLHASAASVCMYVEGDYARALEFLQGALDRGFEPDRTRETMAEAHYRLGDYPRSLALYSELLESGFRSFSACLNTANLLVREQQFGPAIEWLEQALVLGTAGEELTTKIRHNISYLRDRMS